MLASITVIGTHSDDNASELDNARGSGLNLPRAPRRGPRMTVDIEAGSTNSGMLACAAGGTGSGTPTFVDVFAGCGGLSLGLLKAGWRGLFAVEKDTNAFQTLRANLVDGDAPFKFDWPGWLPKQPWAVNDVLSQHGAQLAALAGRVDLLVGGPPCQGFSSAGRRDPMDPRNQLFATYLEFVSVLKPRFVLIENVRGMTADFANADSAGETTNFARNLLDALAVDFHVRPMTLDFSKFGVPQNRHRFVVIGVRRSTATPDMVPPDIFDTVEAERLHFLEGHGLTHSTSARDALSDLEVGANGKQICAECPRFEETRYAPPQSVYQQLMHGGAGAEVSDTRLARHSADITSRFEALISFAHTHGRLNVSMRNELLRTYGLKKQAMRVLDPDAPAPTITSLPDDLLHYAEPRTLTVRENARLQSFPDWFAFRGKYTTGGDRRRKEVPRFTQVANAVPPLVAEVLGRAIMRRWRDTE